MVIGHGSDGYQFRTTFDPVASLRRGSSANRRAARSVSRCLAELQHSRSRLSLVLFGVIPGKYTHPVHFITLFIQVISGKVELKDKFAISASISYSVAEWYIIVVFVFFYENETQVFWIEIFCFSNSCY